MQRQSSENGSRPDAPGVSVIIPFFNDHRLGLCLEALDGQTYAGPVQVIVIDNGSTLDFADVRTAFPHVLFLHEPKPGSYNARNLGLAHAVHPVLAFTDSDCRPHADWLENAVTRLRTDAEIGLVAGCIKVTMTRPSTVELFEYACAFPQKDYVERGRYGATANVVTTRAVMDRVGPFNGALRSRGDEEWGNRVAAAGLRVVYEPTAIVDHPARTSRREIFEKARRTVGGERDRRPGWVPCLRFIARNLKPQRRQSLRVLGDRSLALAAGPRLRILGFMLQLQWYLAWNRLTLQFRGLPSPRM